MEREKLSIEDIDAILHHEMTQFRARPTMSRQCCDHPSRPHALARRRHY